MRANKTDRTPHDREWQLQEAKNRLSQVVDSALHDGPQTITLRGKPAAVVVSFDEDTLNRISDSVQTAFFEGHGECLVKAWIQEEVISQPFSNRFEADGIEFEIPTVHTFDFNNPLGACPTCEGYGKIIGIDEDLVSLLAECSPLPATYAGGARSLEDLAEVTRLGGGRIDLTIGSALDIFGGAGIHYEDAVEFNRRWLWDQQRRRR